MVDKSTNISLFWNTHKTLQGKIPNCTSNKWINILLQNLYNYFFFCAVIRPLWSSLIIKIVFCTSVHPYIAPAIWVFSGQSFPVTCVCLVALCLSPPGFPWDCQHMLYTVFLAHCSVSLQSLWVFHNQNQPVYTSLKKCQGVSCLWINRAVLSSSYTSTATKNFNTRLQDTHTHLSPVGPHSNQFVAVAALHTGVCKHVLAGYQEYCWVA